MSADRIIGTLYGKPVTAKVAAQYLKDRIIETDAPRIMVDRFTLLDLIDAVLDGGMEAG